MVINPYAKRPATLKRPRPENSTTEWNVVGKTNPGENQHLTGVTGVENAQPAQGFHRKANKFSKSSNARPFSGNYTPTETLGNVYQPSGEHKPRNEFCPQNSLKSVHASRKNAYDTSMPQMDAADVQITTGTAIPMENVMNNPVSSPSSTARPAVPVISRREMKSTDQVASGLPSARSVGATDPHIPQTTSTLSLVKKTFTNPYLKNKAPLRPQTATEAASQILKADHIARPAAHPSIQSTPISKHQDSTPSKKIQASSASQSVSKPAQIALPTIPRPAQWTQKQNENRVGAQSSKTVAIKGPELPGEAKLPAELVYDPDSIKPIKDEYRRALTMNARVDKALDNGWTLYPHQKRAVLKGLMKRRVILALDMGLGKTLIGCVWARAFKASFKSLKIFIVCPVSLKGEWQRTATEATGIAVADEKKSPADSLDASLCTWAKVPTAVNNAVKHFVVVFDEAHMMQSMEAARTKASLKLIGDPRCVGVLLLTGTPMKNGKPANLFPLLKAVRHPLGRHQKAYETHYCEGKLVHFNKGRGPQWFNGGKSNLKQLNRLVESNLLHLTKEECLAAMPPMKKETRHVPISARCQAQYVRAVKDLDALREAMRTNKNIDDNAMLGATQNLRVLCAFSKIDATVQVVKTVLETEDAVVVFTNFAKAAENMKAKLDDSGWNATLLTGKTPPAKRQKLVDAFQEGLSPVFITTFGAGGVGITLTAACTAIFLDRPWTPGEMLQAQDRIRRIGQTKNTRSIWMSAFELDAQVDGMLAEKNQAASAVLGGRNMVNSSGASTSINTQKLLSSIISKAK